jgi:hypothetical protein
MCKGAQMNQQQSLKLLGRIDGPSVVPTAAVEQIKTYRDAVIACWMYRRVKGMTVASLCEQTGMRPSHVSDYLSGSEKDAKGKDRREMPAKYLPAFERVAGNTFITQWLAMQSKLTVLESISADREAA